ncbi:MAG: methyltransferase domain-containing protein [Saprospiraceae bacterium]
MEKKCCIVPDKNDSKKDYWNKNYESKDTQNWIETSEPSIMAWIHQLNLDKNAIIFCAGVGDSNIVKALLDKGFNNIIANDISNIALDKLKKDLNSDKVTYLQDDLINPIMINKYFDKVDLYIDRATLHFFTTCPDKDHYFAQLTNLLKKGGHSILGVFSKDNNPKCCGLDLQLWSIQSLKNRLDTYKHLGEFDQEFKEINGNIRNYIYLLSKK